MNHKITIKCPLVGVGAEIKMDGRVLEGVTAISFSARADELTEIKLTLIGYVDLDVDAAQDEIVRFERKQSRA